MSFLKTLERTHASITPSYAQKKEKIHSKIKIARLVTNALLVACVVFAILSINLIIFGGLSTFFGLPLILVNLPIGYLSYNVGRMLKNSHDIVSNPQEYLSFFPTTLNIKKVKNKLAEKTFYFNLGIEVTLKGVLHFKKKRTQIKKSSSSLS